MPTDSQLERFLAESNRIEGILGPVANALVTASAAFLAESLMLVGPLCRLQAEIAPHRPLRLKPGMNVRVGGYVAPPGGPEIEFALAWICDDANDSASDPWRLHLMFERLHPFMDGNGRTGRALWAWQMLKLGRDPFSLGFLHRWYYQTLEHVGR
jgi:Fic/DOC family protein